MGLDSSSLQSGSKRTRPEDEVYLDNYHVHKRYLSEVMASSLNSLKVGDTLSGGSRMMPQTFDPMESPALTETGCFSKSLSSYPSNGDEVSTLDSYMSDDSDESICYRTGRYCETPQRTLSSLCESSKPASPLKSLKGATCSSSSQAVAGASGFSTSSLPLPCSQLRQRVPDAESRFPPSPSDPCYAADLRRAALLRSLQMRAQSPVAVSDTAAADECLDACGHGLEEAEDQCSPSSPNFDDPSAEQTACNHDILGSPVHGTFPGQVGRGSVHARSLLLDECASTVPATFSDVVPATFNDALSSAINISSLSTGRPKTDSVQSRDMNLECTISSIYPEEVSDSMDKTDNSSGRKWSTPRRERLCDYFYKGNRACNAGDEDQ